jgi:hypothetical protein
MADDLSNHYTIRKWIESNKPIFNRRRIKFAFIGLLIGIIADLLFILTGATFDGKLTVSGLVLGLYNSFKKAKYEPVDADKQIACP